MEKNQDLLMTNCKGEELNRKKNLLLAKLAYRDIMHVINDWEQNSGIHIRFNWDECITIDDENFSCWSEDD